MAEGLARHHYGDVLDVVSAGSRPTGWVHPLAVQALAAVGIDALGQTSKHANLFMDQDFDLVVTLCDSAAQDCPLWPRAKRIEHWSIVDPSYGPDDPATRYDRFVATRDEIALRMAELVGTL